MDKTASIPGLVKARADFEALVQEIRPQLHRYCARMTGSAIDGEDVVQDTLAKAFYLLPQTGGIANLRGWLFRIAHNKAIDYTRSYARQFGEPLDDHTDLAAPSEVLDTKELAKLGLALFIRLTPQQRGAVILKDVLGHSLEETASILDTSVASIKGALHRGRATLRRHSHTMGEKPSLDPAQTSLLEGYVRHFAAREFDQLRAMLAQDAQLDVIGIAQTGGAERVGGYFHRYSGMPDWTAELGILENRPVVIVHDATGPSYCVLIEWEEGKIKTIRDYRYSRYVLDPRESAFIGGPNRV